MQLRDLGNAASKVTAPGRTVIVTDENVAPLYLEECRKSMENAGFEAEAFVVKPGEESKSGAVYLSLMEFLTESQLTRTDCVVALGGGVVGDLAGFVAGTYLRGINVIQVPTTLLAQVDSSIGGKTAINLEAGKNLAGVFHMPKLVWQDPELLKTLPEDQWKNGMAEVIKYGIIYDRDLHDLLCSKADTLKNMDSVIRRCAEIKNEVVAQDEKDKGLRQILNFGHTIGHAIEKASNYGISHGFAVAKGMNYIGEKGLELGWSDQETRDGIKKVLDAYDFDLSIEYPAQQIYDICMSDKKRKGDSIDLVTIEKIGKAEIRRMTTDELGEVICGK